MLEIVGAILVIFGLLLIFLGLTDRNVKKRFESFEVEKKDEEEKKTDVKAGGVVIVGPIPIVFGDSKYAFYTLLLATILMLLLIGFFFFSAL